MSQYDSSGSIPFFGLDVYHSLYPYYHSLCLITSFLILFVNSLSLCQIIMVFLMCISYSICHCLSLWHSLSVCVHSLSEGVVAPWCNPLTLQPEQSGGVGSSPGRTPPLERHDKGSRTRLGLLYFCDPSAWR